MGSEMCIRDRGGELAGRITLRDEEPRLRVARLGIYLRPDLVGRGIGSAALWQFLDLAFGELGLVQIRLDVVAANTRAVRCYTRLGFVRQHVQWCDIPHDPALALLSAPSHEHLRPFFRLRCDPPQALYFELYHLAAWWQMIRRSDAPAHTPARRPGAGAAGRVVLQPDAAFLEA